MQKFANLQISEKLMVQNEYLLAKSALLQPKASLSKSTVLVFLISEPNRAEYLVNKAGYRLAPSPDLDPHGAELRLVRLHRRRARARHVHGLVREHRGERRERPHGILKPRGLGG